MDYGKDGKRFDGCITFHLDMKVTFNKFSHISLTLYGRHYESFKLVPD
jgi:hypothetical protein